MTVSLKEKVRKTAALLDANVPEWRRIVNRDTLDMEDAMTCICGQVFGNFFTADLSVLGYRKSWFTRTGDHRDMENRRDWGYAHGLNADMSASATVRIQQYAELKQIWSDVIEEKVTA